jgi:hypothetical protein
MILDALVGQLGQRFQYEKRAQVCLWFDDRREFARILPALRDHLETLTPAPFRLLEYDEKQHHGQLWLKHPNPPGAGSYASWFICLCPRIGSTVRVRTARRPSTS